MIGKKKTKRLGELLIGAGLITQEQLAEALVLSERSGTRVGTALVSLGYVTEEAIAQTLANQYQMSYVILNKLKPDPGVLDLISDTLVRRYKAMPISIDSGNLKVAMIDPLDVVAIDNLQHASGYRIVPVVTTETELMEAIDRYYGIKDSLDDVVNRVEASELELLNGEEDAPERLEKIASEASIIQLVNIIIAKAAREGASDIHIEPDEGSLRVRSRVDGILHEATILPLTLHPAVISRLKVMGEMNIAEKRLPQDGRFVIKVGESDIDVRLSTLPIIFGEKAVLRLLDKSKMLLSLEQLTPLYDTLDILKDMIRRPYGMLLLSGPTGSGKTTTAYTLLNMLNSIAKNIVTVEDPVEYHINIINQLQVNPGIGITFATALRHILRQDPDIIMVGEIRDRETAEIAIHAALTGHLVISTIHTNTAIGTISRLLDMGVEPYLISSAISCVVGQRLIRSICGECGVTFTPELRLLESLGIDPRSGPFRFNRGEGCIQCNGTGYKGRIGIFEVMMVDQSIRELILSKHDAKAVLEMACKGGFRPLRREGIRAVIKGYTTFEEVLQATQEIE